MQYYRPESENSALLFTVVKCRNMKSTLNKNQNALSNDFK